MGQEMDQDKLEFFTIIIRYSIFIKVFDGDITKWKNFLKKKGSMDQVTDDYPFVLQLEKELKEDPGLLDRIKELLRQYEEAKKEIRRE